MTNVKPAAMPPVLLMLFNRPDTTRQVFEELRKIRPSKMFLAANGPREGNQQDVVECAEVRKIFEEVDWSCEVHTNFREKNIGMQPHWRLALDWFFESVEEGVILEDDCVPNESFFRFAGSMLEKYRSDERIMHVNGSNFQFGNKRGEGSYYFSQYPHVWGWATWKRAWALYDNNISTFETFRDRGDIRGVFSSEEERAYWMKFFGSIYSGAANGCDTKWFYAIVSRKAFCITPNVNMITNIGYGISAGHTLIKDKTLGQPALEMGQIIDPTAAVKPDSVADAYAYRVIFKRTFFQKAFYKSMMLISRLLK